MTETSFNEDDPKYRPIAPHGELEEVADNIYVIMGSHVVVPGLRIGLTMTIIKQGNDLTILNPYRLRKEVEDEVLKLGSLKHLVRISSMHGACDQYFIDKYGGAAAAGMTYWDLPSGPEDKKLPKADKVLTEGGEFPIDGAKILMIQNIKAPEAVVWIPHSGGTLLTADVIQNGRPRPFGSWGGNAFTRAARFLSGHCDCPPFYRMNVGIGKDIYGPNFPRILELEFENIMPGHGPPKKGGAKEDLKIGLSLIKPYASFMSGDDDTPTSQ